VPAEVQHGVDAVHGPGHGLGIGHVGRDRLLTLAGLDRGEVEQAQHPPFAGQSGTQQGADAASGSRHENSHGSPVRHRTRRA
jgi:hypothetical protein